MDFPPYQQHGSMANMQEGFGAESFPRYLENKGNQQNRLRLEKSLSQTLEVDQRT